jgi:hypothetical protein
MNELGFAMEIIAQMASLLPQNGGPAQPLACENCGRGFGAVANSKGIAFGLFLPDVDWSGESASIGVKMVASTVVVRGSVTLTCTGCRRKRIWHL